MANEADPTGVLAIRIAVFGRLIALLHVGPCGNWEVLELPNRNIEHKDAEETEIKFSVASVYSVHSPVSELVSCVASAD